MVRGSVDDGVGLLLLGNFCSFQTLKNHPQTLMNTGQNSSGGCPPLKETLALFLGDTSDYLAKYLSKLLIIVSAKTFCILPSFGTEIGLSLISQLSSGHYLRYKFHKFTYVQKNRAILLILKTA